METSNYKRRFDFLERMLHYILNPQKKLLKLILEKIVWHFTKQKIKLIKKLQQCLYLM